MQDIAIQRSTDRRVFLGIPAEHAWGGVIHCAADNRLDHIFNPAVASQDTLRSHGQSCGVYPLKATKLQNRLIGEIHAPVQFDDPGIRYFLRNVPLGWGIRDAKLTPVAIKNEGGPR